MTLGGDAGAVTVEAAIAIASIVTVIVLCIAAISSVSMNIRCIDAAREAARLASRGDAERAVATASRIGPDGARITLHEDGDYVVATVEVASLLPGLDLTAQAVAAMEPEPAE